METAPAWPPWAFLEGQAQSRGRGYWSTRKDAPKPDFKPRVPAAHPRQVA